MSSRPLSAAGLVLALAACDRGAQHASDSSANGAMPHGDSLLVRVVDERPSVVRDTGLDSAAAERRITELEEFAAVANGPAVALALLRAGVLKMQLRTVVYDSATGTRHPGEYFHDEIAGGWLYTGRELDTLVAQYPSSDLVDDAAFAKIFLVTGGECEGRIDCYIAVGARAPLEFLRAHPRSAYAPNVVTMLNRLFTTRLEGVTDLSRGTELYDPPAVREVLATYDSVSRTLIPPARDSARATIDALLRRFQQSSP